MDDHERYARFVSALGFRAQFADPPATASSVDLVDLDGEAVEPSVRLHVDARLLAEHVGEAGAGFDALEADDLDDAEAARLQTLIAQIEEAILVRETGQDHLVLVDGGVRAVRAGEVGAR